jgi:hypothetical protein
MKRRDEETYSSAFLPIKPGLLWAIGMRSARCNRPLNAIQDIGGPSEQMYCSVKGSE